MATSTTGAIYECPLPAGVIVKMVGCLCGSFLPLPTAFSLPDSLAIPLLLAISFVIAIAFNTSLPASTAAFVVLIVGFCIVACKSRCARRAQTYDLIPHLHTLIERGGVVHAVAMPSRANCPRCLADRRLRARASADRVPLGSSSLSSPSPATTYPLTPYLSPVPLPPLSGLGLTGPDEWDEPASPPPAYGAALDVVAFNPH